jgi:hypothetical protein
MNWGSYDIYPECQLLLEARQLMQCGNICCIVVGALATLGNIGCIDGRFLARFRKLGTVGELQ